MRRTTSLFVVATTVLFGTCAFAEQKAPELPKNLKHPWAGFKPGSYVKMTSTMSGKEVKTSTEEYVTTLAKVDSDFVHLEVDTGSEADRSQTTVIRISVTDLTGSLHGAALKEKSRSSESLEIEGKKYACTIIEFDVVPAPKQEGKGEEDVRVESGSVKLWVSESFPIPLKEEAKVMFGEVEDVSTSAVVKLQEKVKIGGKELTCLVKEYTSRYGTDSTASGRSWICTDVPGFEVKSEGKTMTGEVEVSTAVEVTEFGVK